MAAVRSLTCRTLTAMAVSLPLLLAACGGGGGDQAIAVPQPKLTSITVSPADVQVGVGLWQKVTAQARDQNGAVMAGVVFDWASSNAGVATVAQGTVTGVAAGTGSLSASSAGVASNAVSITVVAVTQGSVVIDKASVFLAGAGQTARLGARILDARGAVSPGSVSWVSSAPDKVAVDATGQVTALAIGSALIVAEAGGLRSPPTIAIVASPQAGALLVTDAQVLAVGPALRLAAGDPAGVGTEYEVTLQGVAAPALGAVMLAAETAPVAGKVVATRQDPAGLVVTLAVAPLHQLFSAYDIRLNLELAGFGFEPVPDRSGAAAVGPVWGQARRQALAEGRARPLDAFDPFKAWKCEASLKPQLVGEPISLALENSLNLVLEDRPGYTRHALEGSAGIVGSAGLKLKAGFKASGRCDAQGQIKFPVFGWFSVLVMPGVRFGLGAEIEGEILLVQGELGVEGRVDLKPVLGWECGGATSACRGLNDFVLTNDFKTKSRIPSSNDMQAKVSAHFYVIAGLDAVVFLGAANAGLVEGRLGPKQSFDLAFEDDQAARPDYASSYDLKLVGVIEPGPALKKAIEKVIGDDSTTVKLEATFNKDLSESPKGALSVSTAKVRPGSPVEFTVDLTPASSVQYWVIGYNVTGIALHRRAAGETEFTHWKAMDQIGSHKATYKWVPTTADAGTYEFAALVNTELLTPWLELAANTVQTVEVSCFAASGVAAAPAGRAKALSAPARAAAARPLALTCDDSWAGTSTYIAKTPGLPSANITARATITWTPTAPSGTTLIYKAGGSFDVAINHPDDCSSRLVPRTFAIVEDPLTQARLMFFDDGFNPPSYGIGASQLIDTTVTVSCPGKTDTVTELRGFQVVYATGNGPYTPGQATLSGRIEDAATTADWSFSRP